MANYKYNDNTQLTQHFNVSEFRCKCGGTHETILNPELPKKLESLYSTLKCSKIIINSGYRCYTHDRAVGGSGRGEHVNGNAADIVCYDKDGNRISSKKVCCAAQDLKFGGIANIDATYTAAHVDVRSSNFWKGDETITTAYSLTDDFYSYYKLSKKDVYPAGVKNSIQVSITLDGQTFTGELETT